MMQLEIIQGSSMEDKIRLGSPVRFPLRDTIWREVEDLICLSVEESVWESALILIEDQVFGVEARILVWRKLRSGKD